MSDGPKLFTSKPRKGQLKPKVEVNPSAPNPTSPPSMEPPKESFARRYKFVWPLLLTVNLAFGVYLFTRTSQKKDPGVETAEVEREVPAPVAAGEAVTAPSVKISNVSSSQPVSVPATARQPIPEDEQRQLFKWILEEKRKIKPADPSEKKRIDDEKAILKQYIRAKSIPTV